MAEHRFIVGIDLGTTNSAMAYVDTSGKDRLVKNFPVLQAVSPTEVEYRDTLPSFMYQPTAGEFAQGALTLPWESGATESVVGIFARDHGSLIPGRLVSSTKSWLCHTGIDRLAPLLPWHAAADAKRYSPVDVSAKLLAHMRSAWNYAYPEHPLEKQDVVVTVPASFDEMARELTITAAQRAGLSNFTLLEEPQAAFYAWLNGHEGDWEKNLLPGETVLVCDVGGGTTDFTLIRASLGRDDKITLNRISVGDHLILGGDNLDLALAHHVEKKILGSGRFEPREWGLVIRSCRMLKERLLGPNPPNSETLHLPSSSSKIIGGGRQVELTREETQQLLVDGFLPFAERSARPSKRAGGFQEFGLPYAADPAITHYLAAFLSTPTLHSEEAGAEQMIRPDALLLNGGLFESPAMRERLVDIIQSWAPGESKDGPRLLVNERLDLAVARGAAYYGLARRGQGVRVTSHLPKSYFIGVAHGDSVEQKALCIASAGLEEGSKIDLSSKVFELLVRQPVEFPLFVSRVRTGDHPGDMLTINEDQFTALPPLRTVLKSGRKKTEIIVQVSLSTQLTELGTLEIWCHEVKGDRKWRLQFDARATNIAEATSPPVIAPAGHFEEATMQLCEEVIKATFQPAGGNTPLKPDALVKAMEQITETQRLDWSPAFLRRIWDTLYDCEAGRQLSAEHEARWLNFLGFSLRPGFGHPVDDWRVEQTWRLHPQGVLHPSNELCQAEWLILWRRIAGGLKIGQQTTLSDPFFAMLRTQRRQGKLRGSKIAAGNEFNGGRHVAAETWRLLGALEWLDINKKIELGNILSEKIGRKGPDAENGACLWALARIATRKPLYGPLNSVVPAQTLADWLTQIKHGQFAERHLLAISLMLQHTGDRYRDIPSALGEEMLRWLEERGAPEHLLKLVRSGGGLSEEEKGVAFGDRLPHGLRQLT